MINNIFSPEWVHKKYYLGRVDSFDGNGNDESTDMFFYSHNNRYVVKVRREGNEVRTSIEEVIQFDYDIYCLEYNDGYKTPLEFKEIYLTELPKEYLDEAIEDESLPDPKIESHWQDKFLYDDKTKMVVCIDAEDWGEYPLFPLWNIVDDSDIEKDEDIAEIATSDIDVDVLEVMICRIEGTTPEEW
ncbi:MAG: hypothetical protein IIX48_05050 [Lachnospiraceae bacterium]|nr:hypothetical protein [Lachnospiraceae bacterium]